MYVQQAIKLAQQHGRISELETSEMKESLANRTPFLTETSDKLSRGERLLFLDTKGAEETNERDENDDIEQQALIRDVVLI